MLVVLFIRTYIYYVTIICRSIILAILYVYMGIIYINEIDFTDICMNCSHATSVFSD